MIPPDLVSCLGLRDRGELVSIVGGGGKSALLFRLAEELEGRVVLTTTTRIFAAQIERAPEYCTPNPEELAEALSRGRSGLLVIGGIEGEKARGVPVDLPGRLLEHPSVDHVVVEADGSRMRPAKAPAEHEPVIAHETSVLVALAGIDALSGPIRETTHRPERVASLTNTPLDQPLSPDGLATLLSHPDGGMKNAPPGARRVILLNKVESAEQADLAERVAWAALSNGRVECVVSGALELPGSPWRVYSNDEKG
jgi:molybdenum cofactor cytidylyltransferase